MIKILLVFFCRDQVRILVEGFFTLNQDIPAFKEHLRDFLVQIKVNFVISSERLCDMQGGEGGSSSRGVPGTNIGWTWLITAPPPPRRAGEAL